MSGPRTLTVGPDEGDQRLDRWLRRRFAHATQGRIERMCRKGEIRVDGGRVRPATRVSAGQAVRVPPLAEGERGPDGDPTEVGRPVSGADAEMIRDAVLYRDDHLLVLNKPPGLPAQGGSGQARHVDGLAGALAFDRDEKPRLVHRLDKDTSGVLLMARSRTAAARLAGTFRNRDARKVYWAAVVGVPNPRAGAVRYGLVKAPGGGGRRAEAGKMLCVHPQDVAATPGARRAATDYAVLAHLARRAAWVALAPATGRTHQLRAHMAGIGNPIVGDGKYGGPGQENPGDGWGAQLGGEISRKLHLHARHLSFVHPFTGARMTFTAPLPDHMRRTWAVFDWRDTNAPADPFGDPE